MLQPEGCQQRQVGLVAAAVLPLLHRRAHRLRGRQAAVRRARVNVDARRRDRGEDRRDWCGGRGSYLVDGLRRLSGEKLAIERIGKPADYIHREISDYDQRYDENNPISRKERGKEKRTEGRTNPYLPIGRYFIIIPHHPSTPSAPLFPCRSRPHHPPQPLPPLRPSLPVQDFH